MARLVNALAAQLNLIAQLWCKTTTTTTRHGMVLSSDDAPLSKKVQINDDTLLVMY